jgi:hypothetical protein
VRAAPKLALVFPPESKPRLTFLDAHNEEDEQRVLDWCASSLVLVDGAQTLLALLNQLLDERETTT